MQLARRMRQVLATMNIAPGILNARHLLSSGGLADELVEYRKVRVVCVCACVLATLVCVLCAMCNPLQIAEREVGSDTHPFPSAICKWTAHHHVSFLSLSF